MKKTLLSILVVTALSSIGNAQQTSEEATKKIDAGVMVKSDEKAERRME
tara:strand:+ start:38 stop:184 length:147 start_codon:yes stop_codon:yes gene_type:complete